MCDQHNTFTTGTSVATFIHIKQKNSKCKLQAYRIIYMLQIYTWTENSSDSQWAGPANHFPRPSFDHYRWLD